MGSGWSIREKKPILVVNFIVNFESLRLRLTTIFGIYKTNWSFRNHASTLTDTDDGSVPFATNASALSNPHGASTLTTHHWTHPPWQSITERIHPDNTSLNACTLTALTYPLRQHITTDSPWQHITIAPTLTTHHYRIHPDSYQHAPTYRLCWVHVSKDHCLIEFETLCANFAHLLDVSFLGTGLWTV